eukprot:TRINITY_DN1120_c0_g1_i2.p1 TRINITY_DN1120_c0_g1~~TRINITY_DN1120_c0_g1_i2.p1  ORF type:complete len:179 (+),score=40.94 TRINITY_DN1120_c0_g1_i2:79-615(+)
MTTSFDGPTPTEKFQRDTLQLYADGDREFERELIEEYRTSVQAHLPQLVEILAKDTFTHDDEEGAVLHSHDIKGCSSYIGAEAVRFVSGKMEQYCKVKDYKEASKYSAELQKEVTRIFSILDKYLADPEAELDVEGDGDVDANNNNTDKSNNNDKADPKKEEAKKDGASTPSSTSQKS